MNFLFFLSFLSLTFLGNVSLRKQPTFRDATTGFLDFLKVVRLVFWSGVVGPARSRFALKSSTCEQVYWFPREMTSEKQEQKFHTDDASLPRSG